MKSLAIVAGVLLSNVFRTCTGRAPETNPTARSSNGSPAPGFSASLPLSATSGNLPLRTLRDVSLSGGVTRFDYQSFDPNTGRLYIAHLGDGSMVVFDTNKETLVGDVKELPRV